MRDDGRMPSLALLGGPFQRIGGISFGGDMALVSSHDGSQHEVDALMEAFEVTDQALAAKPARSMIELNSALLGYRQKISTTS